MIPVANEQTGEFENLEEKEILFLVVKKSTTYFHTHRGIYRRLKGIEEFVNIFEPHGFTLAYRHILAQIHLVTRYDPLLKIAYFDHPDYPAQACYVTAEIGEIITKMLKERENEKRP